MHCYLNLKYAQTKCDPWVEVNKSWDVNSSKDVSHAEGNGFYA